MPAVRQKLHLSPCADFRDRLSSEKHLHRYLAEFDFRYNNREALGTNDTMRAEELAKGIVGKRLTYRRPHEA